MIKYVVFLALVFYGHSLYAQNSFSQKLYAYRELKPELKSAAIYFIFIELAKSDTPIWKSASISNENFDVHYSLVNHFPMVVGIRKKDQRIIRIAPLPGNNLWKLEFDLTTQNGPVAGELSDGKVALKGVFKNREIKSTISQFVDLQSP